MSYSTENETDDASARTYQQARKSPAPIFFKDPYTRASIFACSITGASHVQTNKVCQDAYKVSTGRGSSGGWIAFAVSDGHGADKHDLSDIGAMIACSKACQVLEDLALKASTSDFVSWDEMRRKAPSIIHGEWLNACEITHVNSGHAELFDAKRYGATLLAGIMLGEKLTLFRIGDSDAVVIGQDGDIRSVFEDDDLEGEKTYSLCLRDAEAMFDHVEFSVSELKSLMLATDGLKKSFSTDQAFFRFLRSVEKQVEVLGPGPIAEAIPDPLQKATSEGSGDDITLVSLLFETNSPQETDAVDESDAQTETSERANPAQDQTETHIMD